MRENNHKRFVGDYLYSITSVVEKRIPFFKNMLLANFWIEVLKVAKLKHQFMLYAFCLNYDHFHLLILPNNDMGNCSKILQFLKRNTSRNFNKILGYSKINPLSVSDISQCRGNIQNDRPRDNGNYRLQGGGNDIKTNLKCNNSNCRLRRNENMTGDPPKDNGNYRLQGGGNDIQNNLTRNNSNYQPENNRTHQTIDDISQCRFNKTHSPTLASDIPQCRDEEVKTAIQQLNHRVHQQRQEFISKYGENHTIPKFKWQKSFHDHIIRVEKDFQNQWKYINYNYLKHGLPEDWKFTGLKHKEIIDDWEL